MFDMTWKEWLGYGLYKKLWSLTTGRPFTFILRDIWHKFEWFWIIALISTGVWMGHHFAWVEVLKYLGVFTVGYIGGHLFWGKEYKPNQQGD